MVRLNHEGRRKGVLAFASPCVGTICTGWSAARMGVFIFPSVTGVFICKPQTEDCCTMRAQGPFSGVSRMALHSKWCMWVCAIPRNLLSMTTEIFSPATIIPMPETGHASFRSCLVGRPVGAWSTRLWKAAINGDRGIRKGSGRWSTRSDLDGRRLRLPIWGVVLRDWFTIPGQDFAPIWRAVSSCVISVVTRQLLSCGGFASSRMERDIDSRKRKSLSRVSCVQMSISHRMEPCGFLHGGAVGFRRIAGGFLSSPIPMVCARPLKWEFRIC